MGNAPPSLAAAREEFLRLVEDVRPELHRYCARLVGSVIEGEDLVQETLAKGFYALSLQPEMPVLRPWLFKIAHNAALDFLKRHHVTRTELVAEVEDVAGYQELSDPFVVRAALAKFLVLPVIQRSAVILKDVLGHSLEETAETMATTIPAVKAALVRGRARLRSEDTQGDQAPPSALPALQRYASLFNARDWDGVRALVSEDCHLDLVSKTQRRGKAVGQYFARYEKERVQLRPGRLEGQWVLGAYVDGAEQPAYFILLDVTDGKVAGIRDFRYVTYVAKEAEFEPAPAPTP